MLFLELFGVASAVLCIWLYARQNIWCWPIGIVNNLLLIALFLPKKLYADLGLQIVYIVLGVYGWYWWLHGGENRSTLPVSRTPLWQWPLLSTLAAGATFGLARVLDVYTDSNVPLPDAATTVLSLVAQWMIGRKYLENWWVWIAANLLYIPLYLFKEMPFLAAIQLVFIALSLSGWLHWKREYEGRELNEMTYSVSRSPAE